MSFEPLAVGALLWLSTLLGISPYPQGDSEWRLLKAWQDESGYSVFEATTQTIPTECRAHPTAFIKFPMVIHGAHEIFADGNLIEKSGDPTFRTVQTFYGAPFLQCADIVQARTLTWKVVSYSKYFARISFFPRVVADRPLHNVLAESFHVMGAGAAFIVAFFAITIFWGRVSRMLTLSVFCSCLSAAIYFAGAVGGLVGLRWSMLLTHKIADIGVWLGIALVMNALRIEGMLGNKAYFIYLANVAIGLFIIALGSSGDVIQLGTSLPFGASMVVLFIPFIAGLRDLATSRFDNKNMLRILSLLSFITACFNEVFVVLGLINSSPMLPVGFLAGVLFFAFSVNERINETYRERDYLRENLEAEVQRKTEELTKKTEDLVAAMASLKSTQAELVQSAKLASLGTLSAGIAHEINNSLNYVNGALQPLERLVVKAAKNCSPEEQSKIDRLMAVMKEGLALTLEIIKSLRSYTGLNQAKFNDVDLKKAAQTSLTILRNKTRGKIEVDLRIPDNLIFFGSVVGINQIFMNLISNAIDAMPEGGRLILEADASSPETIEICIHDTGCGMAPETAARIFDPFFTTKEVGKGTGLGLHIVRSEVERHNGNIEVESVLGEGTCFRINVPRNANTEQRSAA
jgi:signal transduction histidine kinase